MNKFFSDLLIVRFIKKLFNKNIIKYIEKQLKYFKKIQKIYSLSINLILKIVFSRLNNKNYDTNKKYNRLYFLIK